MTAVISTTDDVQRNWAASGTDRVVQNVLNLISLIRYEVAYNRTLGISPDIVDRPSDEAAAAYISEIVRVVEQNEPRATIQEIAYTGTTPTGEMNIRVVMDIA